METWDDRPAKGGSRDPLIGRVLEERYRLEEKLGEGGVGVVYQGVHLRLGRPVAIKVLQRAYGANDALRLRFEREARAMAALSHPNIVPLTDFGVSEGTPYLVMEVLEGWTLADLLDTGPVEPKRAFEIARQVLRALAYAHGEGLAHRDLKPENVFLQKLPDEADHVRLLDFGLAKFVMVDDARDGPQVTIAGVAFGTPAYMAPELATGKPSDVRADVYAAGVVLFEMLAGRRPFEGEPAELLRKQVLDTPPSLFETCPERHPVPELDALIRHALAKDPTNRYADASEMLEALGALPRPSIQKRAPLGGDRQAATEEMDPAIAPTMAAMPTADLKPRRPSSRPLLLGLVGLGAALAIGLGIAVGTRGAVAPETQVVVVQSPEANEPTARVQPAALPESVHAAQPAKATLPPETLLAASSPPGDPWSDDVPPLLARTRERLDRGGQVGEGTVRSLRALAMGDREDPRPFLLLARIYLSRRWRSDAIDRYERAWRRDPSARGDPQMISDLLGLVAHETAGARASRAVRQIYGAEALPALDSALAAPDLDPATRMRLQRLRNALR